MSDHEEVAYALAKARYAELNVDTVAALRTLAATPFSLPCWQADDVTGTEHVTESPGGGLAAAGNYPGRARNLSEVRDDLATAAKLIPGEHRFNVHAMYADFGGRNVDRDEISPEHFRSWADWAVDLKAGLDFNCTCFAHPKAASGLTLANPDPAIRRFWVRHVQRCRQVSLALGQRLGKRVIHNIWIPDGTKDQTVWRYAHREWLARSLDEIFSVDGDAAISVDALEGKLFGLGSESFVVGSHDFYLAYALRHDKMLCLDMGHFHPTESVADKISALLLFFPELLLHLSRGVRWDSDHVLTLSDASLEVMQEIVRAQAVDRVSFALDYFDGSINRVGAYVVGARAAQKCLLFALLEPRKRLTECEAASRGFERLALLEAAKSMPWGAVWDYFCVQQGVALDHQVWSEIATYEKNVLARR